MSFAPIILFVYNRPAHTSRTLEALKKNPPAINSDLIIYSDAAPNESNEAKVREVRALIGNVTGFKSVTIVEREQNLGLAKSVIAGVTETVNRFSKVIVLEDDLETSPYFLQFMNDGLSLYEHDTQVASIHGYIYPVKNPDAYFFIRGADCWGWATWKRAWDLFEEDGENLYNQLIHKNLTHEFDFAGSYPYTKMLREQIAGKNNSWAVRWYASMFLRGMLTLYPGKSFVRNTGNDASGIHSAADAAYEPILVSEYRGMEKIEMTENLRCKNLMTSFFRNIRPSMVGRIKMAVKNYFK